MSSIKILLPNNCQTYFHQKFLESGATIIFRQLPYHHETVIIHLPCLSKQNKIFIFVCIALNNVELVTRQSYWTLISVLSNAFSSLVPMVTKFFPIRKREDGRNGERHRKRSKSMVTMFFLSFSWNNQIECLTN